MPGDVRVSSRLNAGRLSTPNETGSLRTNQTRPENASRASAHTLPIAASTICTFGRWTRVVCEPLRQLGNLSMHPPRSFVGAAMYGGPQPPIRGGSLAPAANRGASETRAPHYRQVLRQPKWGTGSVGVSDPSRVACSSCGDGDRWSASWNAPTGRRTLMINDNEPVRPQSEECAV